MHLPRLPRPAATTIAPLLGGRDHAIDFVKGVACLLMVVAHVPFPHAVWLKEATLGSVLFFACTGMNLVGLLERRPGHEWRLAANALFLIFAGFANNYVQGTMGQADVFQSAGLAILAMLLLRCMLPSIWTWLFPLPFLIHWANQNIFFWKISSGGLSSFFLAPGLFPMLPWLTFYLLGAHLRLYGGVRMRLGVGLAALGGLALAAGRWAWVWNKFWMSPDYWLAGCAMAALTLTAARAWTAPANSRVGRELRFWGSNSLVFYLLHAFVIRGLEIWVPGGAGLLSGTVAGTALLLRPGLRLQAWAGARPALPMLGASAGVAGLVLGLEAVALHGFLARTFIAFGVTLAFLVAQPAWKRSTRRLGPAHEPRHRGPAAIGGTETATAAGSVA